MELGGKGANIVFDDAEFEAQYEETDVDLYLVGLEGASFRRRVAEVVKSIQNATFTGRGDKNKVVELYRDYASRIAGVLQKTLATPLATGIGAAFGAEATRASTPGSSTAAAAHGVASARIRCVSCESGGNASPQPRAADPTASKKSRASSSLIATNQCTANDLCLF